MWRGEKKRGVGEEYYAKGKVKERFDEEGKEGKGSGNRGERGRGVGIMEKGERGRNLVMEDEGSAKWKGEERIKGVGMR